MKILSFISSMTIFGALLLASLTPINGFAQTPEPTPTVSPSPTPKPTPEDKTAETQPAPVKYFMPDLKPGLTTYNNKYFSFKLSFVVLADYTQIFQNAASRSQVGPQASIFDLRAARIMFSGQIKFKKPWTYLFAYDFNELRKEGDRVFDKMDMNLTIPLWKEARVTIGRQKEPFVYEMAGDAASLAAQERVLSPFFASRNTGIKYSDNFLKDRTSLSIGVFSDVLKKNIVDRGIQVSGRFTGLPMVSKDGRDYLHLGVALRYNGADDGKMRFKGRPETNATDNYLDTGSFTASHADEVGLEFLYNRGPFSILSEYTHAWVASPQTANPGFSGFYVTGSYVLTGENRPYDKKAGITRRIIPKSHWGAWEIVGRYSYLDIDDTLVHGGKLSKWYAGVNWWASQQWKMGVGYGHADLDKNNVIGRTQMLHFRTQWIY